VAFAIYGAQCLFSASMQAEFIRFGLERFRVLTGILEVLGGVGLLVGLKWPRGGSARVSTMGGGVMIDQWHVTKTDIGASTASSM